MRRACCFDLTPVCSMDDYWDILLGKASSCKERKAIRCTKRDPFMKIVR